MDEERATIILAKELGDKVGRLIVGEALYKEKLIKSALTTYQTDDPFFIPGYRGKDKKILAKFNKSLFPEANYFFLEPIPLHMNNERLHFMVTPYALIGDKEKSNLRRLFYKDVPEGIVKSMNVLCIENFISLYKDYTLPRPLLPPSDLEVINRFIDLVPKLNYDGDDETCKTSFNRLGGVRSLNSMFKEIGISARISSKGAYDNSYVKKANISKVVSQLRSKVIKEYKASDNLLNEFFSFVFSLPYEDQNIESNRRILSRSEDLEFITGVLTKEYVQGKYFKEYFEVLNKDVQKEVVNSLGLSLHKSSYSTYLWAKGFKNIKLDYLKLYEEDAELFIEFFRNKSLQKKKTILNEIMESDIANEEVIGWLDKHEPELLKEASFNG